MTSFRKNNYPVTVLHDPEGVVEGIIILFQIFITVPEPVYREYFHAVKNACNEFLLEDVSPGKKNQLPVKGADDRQGIHECILVVGCQDGGDRKIKMVLAVCNHLAVSYTHLTLPTNRE